jgi:hypothetical protein
MAEGDLSWYRDILLLPTEGGIPGLPGGGVKATKVDCVAAFGLATSASRYEFRGCGSLQYELYMTELMEQTQ